ncbi:hypothetical protein C8R47DRAFT_1238190 [Mycena vitilis]|nr:hypothetical protein C8R47DRAFT_1238190 [Mycena vitilis]
MPYGETLFIFSPLRSLKIAQLLELILRSNTLPSATVASIMHDVIEDSPREVARYATEIQRLEESLPCPSPDGFPTELAATGTLKVARLAKAYLLALSGTTIIIMDTPVFWATIAVDTYKWPKSCERQSPYSISLSSVAARTIRRARSSLCETLETLLELDAVMEDAAHPGLRGRACSWPAVLTDDLLILPGILVIRSPTSSQFCES